MTQRTMNTLFRCSVLVAGLLALTIAGCGKGQGPSAPLPVTPASPAGGAERGIATEEIPTDPPRHFTIGVDLEGSLSTQELNKEPETIGDFKPYLRGDDMAFVIKQRGGDAIPWKLELRDDQDVVIQSWQGQGSQSVYWDGQTTEVRPSNPLTDYQLVFWRLPLHTQALHTMAGAKQSKVLKRINFNNEGFAFVNEETCRWCSETNPLKLVFADKTRTVVEQIYYAKGYRSLNEIPVIKNKTYASMALTNTEWFGVEQRNVFGELWLAGDVIDRGQLVRASQLLYSLQSFPRMFLGRLANSDQLVVKRGSQLFQEKVPQSPKRYHRRTGQFIGYDVERQPTYRPNDYLWGVFGLGNALSEADAASLGNSAGERVVLGLLSNQNPVMAYSSGGATPVQIGTFLQQTYGAQYALFFDGGGSVKVYAKVKKDKIDRVEGERAVPVYLLIRPRNTTTTS